MVKGLSTARAVEKVEPPKVCAINSDKQGKQVLCQVHILPERSRSDADSRKSPRI